MQHWITYKNGGNHLICGVITNKINFWRGVSKLLRRLYFSSNGGKVLCDGTTALPRITSGGEVSIR